MKTPKCVGPYTLLSPLGERACDVWLASMGNGTDRVALKLARAGDFARRARLLHEVGIAGSFDHPHIVRMYECGEADGVVWMASGYVPGPQVALTLANFRQLLLALVHVHAYGVVHAEITPDKLLLDQHGNARLAGFGNARRDTAGPISPRFFTQFMPPEQARGEELDSRADLYSAGAVLYYILTGRPPFEGEARRAGKHAVGATVRPDALPPPSAVVRGLGGSFDKLVATALAFDKTDRYASAFVMLKEFDVACGRGVRTAVGSSTVSACTATAQP